MKYEGSLQHNELDIDFSFDLSDDQDALLLCDWTAFDQGGNEFNIPCQVELSYIEKLIEEHLEDLWDREGHNYVQDYREYLGDKMHDYYTDR